MASVILQSPQMSRWHCNSGGIATSKEVEWQHSVRGLETSRGIELHFGRSLSDSDVATWIQWFERVRPSFGGRMHFRLVDFQENHLSGSNLNKLLESIIKENVTLERLLLFGNGLSTTRVLWPLLSTGRCHEVHLSHNLLTSEAIIETLEIVGSAKKSYPVFDSWRGVWQPLWLRLHDNPGSNSSKVRQYLQRQTHRDFCLTMTVSGDACAPGRCCRPGPLPRIHLKCSERGVVLRDAPAVKKAPKAIYPLAPPAAEGGIRTRKCWGRAEAPADRTLVDAAPLEELHNVSDFPPLAAALLKTSRPPRPPTAPAA